ncbi:hypothetical protein JCM10212_003223 [Sporobolomyces blumeae]
MAKKGAKGPSEPTASTPVVSRDAFQRLSYLYQASVALNAAGVHLDLAGNTGQGQSGAQVLHEQGQDEQGDAAQVDVPGEVEPIRVDAATETAAPTADTPGRRSGSHLQERGGKRSRVEVSDLKPISRHLLRSMSEVAKKATVRMDPAVKRTVCKGCDAVLVPGISSSVRVKTSGPHAHVIVHTCSGCRARRKLPAPPVLQTDQPSGTSELVALPTSARSTKPPKRERKWARQARPPTFFERSGHVVVAGGQVVRRDEDFRREG